MSLRRRLMEKAKKKDGTLATNWYVINQEISQTAGYANHSYYFAIFINGKNYFYEAKWNFPKRFNTNPKN